MRLWAALLLAAWAAPARAYDSSGGARIQELLTRLTFSRSQSKELNPPFFPWNAATRSQAAALLGAVFEQMPLDVARLPVAGIVFSNGRCMDDISADFSGTPGFQRQPLRTRREIYLRECDGDDAQYDPNTRVLSVSGSYLRATGTPAGDREFARAVLHEMTHAWNKGADESRPGLTAGFFVIRFQSAAKFWEGVQQAHPSDRSADAIYEQSRLPSRYGGSTGRTAFLEAYRGRVDEHAMLSEHEYLAVLSELLWADPALAGRYYDPKEIAWVEENVFGGRAIVPFHEPASVPIALRPRLDSRLPSRAAAAMASGAAALSR